MKLTVNRDDLLPALERLHRIVERRHAIPVLGNVRLAAGDKSLSVTATDLDMEGTATVPAEIGAAGETTVPAVLLHDFVKRCEGQTVALTEEEGKGKLIVKCGRARATLNTLPAADFPSFSDGKFSHSFELKADQLAEMITRVSFAISSEETRYYLNGIYLHTAETDGAPTLRAVATDGHRLALIEVPLPGGAAGMPGIIVPRKAVAELAALTKGMKDAVFRIEVCSTKMRVTAGAATTLATKLIDGTFPDYARVIPRGNRKTARIEKSALSAAVDRVSTVSNDRGRAVKFGFSKEQIRLSVTNAETGEAVDEVETEFVGGELEIGFNGGYVLGILAAIPAETIHMALEDPGSPCLITIDKPTPLYVVMPMRV